MEVQWSPVHEDKFITWGSELRLYEVREKGDILQSSEILISEKTVAHQLATNSSHPYIRCVDIYPQPEPDILLAVGLANGKVVLTTFGPTVFDALGLANKELPPKHARQCNAVAWNPVDPNLLICGLDKYRTDHSILLWDVVRTHNSNPPLHQQIHHHSTSSQSDHTTIKPLSEAGVCKTTHSISWFTNNSRCCVAGVNNKLLKIIDFRASVRVVSSTRTKSVYSVSVNPHNSHHLVSHIDNQITIWDTRYFEKPVLTLPQSRQIIKILWSPTRHNLLGTIQKDSGALYLHDIYHSGNSASVTPDVKAESVPGPSGAGNVAAVIHEEIEPVVTERTVIPPWTSYPTSFSWHPTDLNRLIAITHQGSLSDYTAYERIALNWSKKSHLAWNDGSELIKYFTSSQINHEFNDISILMKKRANTDYGLLPELYLNGDLAENDQLKKLWQWLDLSRSLVEKGIIHSTDNQHPGVRTVMKLDGQSDKFITSEMINQPWSDIPSHTSKIYKSSVRNKALQLCGWTADLHAKSEQEGDYTRAAAVSVFNLSLRQAIQILERGASKTEAPNNLNIVVMALSGFSDTMNRVWKESCLKMGKTLSDPYLKVIFAFLTADNDSYEAVLNEEGVAIEDRVAFALLYLPDSKLAEYLEQLTAKMIEKGDLAGFLLTGATMDGIKLLNTYLNRTVDVQSCSLIAIQAFSLKLLQEDQLQVWIESYRGLLNEWKFWHLRAHFDIVMRKRTNVKPPSQIYITCNYCGKSISPAMQGSSRVAGVPFTRYGNSPKQLKVTSCLNCRKPLNRCAICLMNMGTASGSQALAAGMSKMVIQDDEASKLNGFDDWFTWCQICQHGGHAGHIDNWFEKHSECPVSNCNCRCFSLNSEDVDEGVNTF